MTLARRNASRAVVAVSLLLVMVSASAHESGPAHHDGAPTAASASNGERPRRVSPDRLYVPKSVQHHLGLRTQPFASSTTHTTSRLGEVLAHPDAPGAVGVPEPGRLERAAGSAWPVPGQVVRAGQPLAVLVPLMSDRERAQRRAALALVEQKLHLARVNVGRMRLQAESRGDAPVGDNLYLEQAEAELATQERIAALAHEGLKGHVVLRASAAGVIGPARVQPGDVVAAGDRLFEIVGAGRARVAVDLYDAGATTRLLRARLVREPDLVLVMRGVEPHPTRPGWRVLLDVPPRRDAPLQPGALVEVELETSAAGPDASIGCPGAAGEPEHVWVHVEPEWFERRMTACTGTSALSGGDRVVISGAALLDEYR